MEMNKQREKGGDSNTICYPGVFVNVLVVCSSVSIIFGVFTAYKFWETGVAMVFYICGVISILIALSIRRFKIKVEKERLLIVPLIGKRRTYKLSEIECVKQDQDGGIEIIVQGKTIITVNPILTGISRSVQFLEEQGVHIYFEK